MYKKILVPTDGSEVSEQAVAAAIDFARAQHSEIVAISVAQPYLLVPAVEGAMMVDTAFETRVLLDLAQQNVDRIAQAAAAAGVPCKTVMAFSSAPHVEIVKAARENQCDLIFMGSHGRRGLSKLLAGSETQNVLAYSTIPVMVLRPRVHEGAHAAPSLGDISAGAAP